MICPRCGYPEADSICSLCGQCDFYSYEINRFQGSISSNFELTLSFPAASEYDQVLSLLHPGLKYQRTTESTQRHFVFFESTYLKDISVFIKKIKPLGRYDILINGRPRPYIEELWLPLLDLLPETVQ